MKYLKVLFGISLGVLFTACGSTEKVITDNGVVYEVKGNNFYSDGVDVTDSLTNNEKDDIMSTLNKRLAEEKEVLKRKQSLEKAEKEAEKAREEAVEKQKEIEKKLEEKEEARQAFFKAKDKLKDAEEKYDRLKEKGKLSPNDEEEWMKKIKRLEADVTSAQKELDKL